MATIEASLQGETQIALARLQDDAVESLLETTPDLVMHGGTAIWRCYSGNRFSYDIDLYATEAQIQKIHRYLTWSLSKRGLKMDYPKGTGRTIYAQNDTTRVKIEAMPPPPRLKGVQKEYERTNGSKLIITTLPIEKFIEEKMVTYERRRYIRDFYDLYHLSSLEPLSKKIRALLSDFIMQAQLPIDENKLKDLIYSGAAPSFPTMFDYIKGRLK